MPLTVIEIFRYSIVGLFCIFLTVAAVRDIRVRLIPNWTVLAILALSLGSAIVGPASSFIASLESGAIALAVTVVLHVFGFIGAGDSKLFSSAATFVGINFLSQLALATSIAGGGLALAMLMADPLRALSVLHMRGRGGMGEGIPYGVAIALASIAVAIGATLRILPVARF